MTTEKFWTRLIRLWKCLLIVSEERKTQVTIRIMQHFLKLHGFVSNILCKLSNTFNRFRYLKVSIDDSIFFEINFNDSLS